jgi:hypothetical protein
MSVETQIQAIFDTTAAVRETIKAAMSGRTSWWSIIDAAADETYENRVKGSDITAADSAIDDMTVWSNNWLRRMFTLHNDYWNADLGLANPYLTSYLATVGWRIPYEAAEAYYEAIGWRVPDQWVFPKGIFAAGDPTDCGMHKFGTLAGTATYTSVDGALPSTMDKGAVIVARSLAATPGGASTPTCTVTLSDATTKDIAVTVNASEWGDVVVGEQAVGAGGAAAAQAVVPVAATAQFKAGEYVWIQDTVDDTLCELCQIDSIVTNTSLTMESNLIKTYGASARVRPMFTNVIWKSGTITAGKSVGFFALPDRTITLIP